MLTIGSFALALFAVLGSVCWACLQEKNPKGSREYILLIEDEAQVAALTAETLVAEGYRVILAQNGFEALKIYRNIGKQIGLVILDFFLPVMDGDAVFYELRVLNPEVDVVLSTGPASPSSKRSTPCWARAFAVLSQSHTRVRTSWRRCAPRSTRVAKVCAQRNRRAAAPGVFAPRPRAAPNTRPLASI